MALIIYISVLTMAKAEIGNLDYFVMFSIISSVASFQFYLFA